MHIVKDVLAGVGIAGIVLSISFGVGNMLTLDDQRERITKLEERADAQTLLNADISKLLVDMEDTDKAIGRWITEVTDNYLDK